MVLWYSPVSPGWRTSVFEEYPPEQLEKMWEHKSYVMGAVLKTKPKVGGSNY